MAYHMPHGVANLSNFIANTAAEDNSLNYAAILDTAADIARAMMHLHKNQVRQALECQNAGCACTTHCSACCTVTQGLVVDASGQAPRRQIPQPRDMSGLGALL